MNGPQERLEAAGIRIISENLTSHFIVERDGFVAFIERREDQFGNIGAPALLTEEGFGVLVWRADRAYFVGKGFEQPASEEQVQKLRTFAADLEKAIAGG